jgi:hypothetical protein
MLGLSTGRYIVLERTTTVNDYGDEVEVLTEEDPTPILGSVIERTKQVFNPDDSRVATVRYLTGRFQHTADIKDGDRIKDVKTGEIFVVESLARPTNAVVKSDIVADLRHA